MAVEIVTARSNGEITTRFETLLLRGVPGSPGSPGAEGLSAYEVAVENGFTGSEEAWLASLVSDIDEAALGLKANKAGDTFTGPILIPTAVSTDDSTTGTNTEWVRAHVANSIDGHNPKNPVRFLVNSATPSLATDFEAGDVYDGLTLVADDRFLRQMLAGSISTPDPSNGIYVVQATGAAVRGTDADTGTELKNATVMVLAGTYAGTFWVQDNTTPTVVPPTDPVVFFQRSSSGTVYTAGDLLTLDVAEFNVLKATGAEAIAGVLDTKAVTPFTSRQHGDARYPILSLTSQQNFAGDVYAPHVRTEHGELKLEDVMPTGVIYWDAATITPEIQDAFDTLINFRYTSFNGQNRPVYINDTLTLDCAHAFNFAMTPIKLCNMKLIADDTFPSPNQEMIKYYDSTGALIQYPIFQDISMYCRNVASGFKIYGYYLGPTWINVLTLNAGLFGIADSPTTAGVGPRLTNCQALQSNAGLAYASRVAVGFDFNNAITGDLKVENCIASCNKFGLRYKGASLLMNNTHIFQGHSAASATGGMTAAVYLNGQPDARITNSYIDNGYLLLQNLAVAAKIQRLDVQNTIFTRAWGLTTEHFVIFDPFGANNVDLEDIRFEGCTFRAFNSGTITEPFAVGMVGGFDGTVDLSTAVNVDIDKNFFWNVTKQSSRIRVRWTLVNGTTSYAYNVTGRTPFALQVNEASPGGGAIRSFSGTKPTAQIINTSAYTGTLELSTNPGSGGGTWTSHLYTDLGDSPT